MPHAKFNWTVRPSLANDGRFQLGETLRLSDVVLTKGEGAQGCTLEVLLEHQSKASQLVIVCNATALELKVALKMAPDYKWLVQIRGTPLPNEPDLYYFRTPEELSTSKLWRLRVKFLFSSPNVTTVRLHSLSLSFDKLTKRGSSGSGSTRASGSLLLPPGVKSVLPTDASSSCSGSAGAPCDRDSEEKERDRDDVSSLHSAMSMSISRSSSSVRSPSPPSLPLPSQRSTPVIVVKGDEGKSEGSGSTSTTASLSTSPTGSSTPTDQDLDHNDLASLASSLGSASVSGYYSSTDGRAPPPPPPHTSTSTSTRQDPSPHPPPRRTSSGGNLNGGGVGMSRKSSSSSLGTSSSGGRRSSKTTHHRGQQDVIQNLVSVMDSVVSAVAGGKGGKTTGSDQLLAAELLQLRGRVCDRVVVDASKTPEQLDAEMASDLQRITAILAAMMTGTSLPLPPSPSPST